MRRRRIDSGTSFSSLVFPTFFAAFLLIGFVLPAVPLDSPSPERPASPPSKVEQGEGVHQGGGLTLFSTDDDTLRSQITRRRHGRRVVGEPEVPVSESFKAQPTSSSSDTLKGSKHALTALDSLLLYPPDSTARIKNFQYVRHDNLAASLFPSYSYPLFLRKPPVYQRSVTLDSTGNFVTVRETVDGKDVKIPITMPLDEYIKLRMEETVRNNWVALAHRYESNQKKDELGSLLSTITKIEIPIPSNPLMSIFGGGGIRLNISGAVDIRAALRNQQMQQVVTSRLGNVRNEPDFNQEVQINVNGQVGDKLNILADWNTQRTFDYENQLKIKYTGYPDEIIQSVEAGNVSLVTPSSLIGGGQALFGIKAAAQLGPLRLTTIASQKKGQTKEMTVSGGSRETTFELRAYQYSQNHFLLDTLYRSAFEDYYGHAVPIVHTDLHVTDIEVWVTRPGFIPDPNERSAVAYIDLPPLPQGGYSDSLRSVTSGIPGRIESGQFIRLKANEQYFLNADAGYITLNTNVQNDQAIAVAYRTQGGNVYGDFTNATSDTARLVLKLIKPKNLIPDYKEAWNLMLKNIYSVGGRNLKKEGFDLSIYYQVPGQEPQDNIMGINLLQVLGFDKVDQSSNPTPDGKFDFIPGKTIDPSRGEIIFASLEPFRAGLIKYFQEHQLANVDSFIYPQVYDTTVNGAQSNSQRDRFIIKGKYTSEISSVYNLGFNLVEGSVQVLLNNQPLAPNVDYTVDYILGQVVIRNQAALSPGANLQIKYEQNDLFQLASKTLLGARGDLRLADNAQLGFTLMNLNQQTLSDKVRLNEEPISNTVFGIDGSATFDAPIITSALNALPLLQTRAPSAISLRGEAAYMLPNPNTRTSPFPVDQGKGIAFIDDFEGARKTIPIGIGYTQWHYGSVPQYVPGLDPDSVHTLPDTTKMFSRARTIWYNVLPSDVSASTIWPNKSVAIEQSQVTVLNVEYHPEERGEFNYSMDLEHTLWADKTKNWGGIMKLLSTTATNLLDENINYIEIWMQVNGNPGKGKMYIDLGQVSEDVIPNGKLDTEDGSVPTSPLPNGVLNDGEDVGLDGRSDAQERQDHAAFIQKYPQYANDPSGDDWSYATGDYSHINGTEGNGISEAGRLPDTEDLNLNGVVDQVNNYFEYEVDLDTTGAAEGLKPQIVGGGSHGWYLFRIPLRDYARKVGTPSLSVVEYVRVWFSGMDSPVLLRIADFNLVGNQWQELAKGDSTLSVTVVNIEDNPDYAASNPPGYRQLDRTRPDQHILSNEQSLSLVISHLKSGDSRYAVRYFPYRPLDVFSYRSMKMFVHGDLSWSYVDTSRYDAELIMRFGNDTLNYYEYREPIHPGWDQVNNNVTIEFTELTALKLLRDSANVPVQRIPTQNGPPGSTYSVRGNPSLTQIKFISIGVENPANKGKSDLNGSVWVNELRVTNVEDTPGWAYKADASVKLADLGNVSFTMATTDPFFHALDQRFGSRALSRDWSLNASLNLEKFLPAKWTGTAIPVNFSHVETISKPRYVPNTDVLVTEAAKRREQAVLRSGGDDAAAKAAADRTLFEAQTIRIRDSYAIPTVKIVIPSEHWWIKHTINETSIGFTYTSSQERSPAIEMSRSWAWSGKLLYSHQFPLDAYISPFEKLFDHIFLLDAYKGYKIFYAPQNFTFSAEVNRSRSQEIARPLSGQTIIQKPIARNFTASRGFAFTWKFSEGGLLSPSMDYSMSAASSLLHLELDSLGNQRRFSTILKDIFLSDRLIDFGIDNGYQQKVGFNVRPKLPPIMNIDRFIDMTAQYVSNYAWQNNFQQGALGKSSRVNTNLTYSMNVKLKQMTDPWFASITLPSKTGGADVRRRSKEEEEIPDTARATRSENVVGGIATHGLDFLKQLLRIFIKVPLLDYENINITFSQSNTIQNSGIIGRTGFMNFWGRVPFLQSSIADYGPSFLYQVGLVSDPSAPVRRFGLSPRFPFVSLETDRGMRAPNGNLVDVFTQSNRISLKTSRSLWEGATIDFVWNTGWDYNRNENLLTDSLGKVQVNSVVATGTVDRSFMTFPSVLFFKFFETDLSQVGKKYEAALQNLDDTRSPGEKLATAFEEGMEAFPLLRKIFGAYTPRMNWTFRWDGLEKLSFFRSFASRVSLDHAYGSTYSQRWRSNPAGGIIVDAQKVMYSFNPLIGLNITFKELWKGNASANLRYNAGESYDLSTSSRNLVGSATRELSLTASYSRRGFSIPFFGISLTNELEVSLSVSYSKTSRRTYDVNALVTNPSGTPLEGSSRTVFEPRIKYILSSRVTASLFYRRIAVVPDAGGSRIPGSTTNEGGLDLHIAIQ